MNPTLTQILMSALALVTTCIQAAEFHVATTGDDANPGTKAKPFATMERARDAIGRSRHEKGQLCLCAAASIRSAPVSSSVLKTPALLTLLLLSALAYVTFTMPMVMNSMLADVCDVDELECGQQRQAFYSAMFVTCDKLAVALAMFLQGLLVAASGFSAKLATQTPETIGFWMKALLFTQPVGFCLGFLCVLTYPITRAKALKVRRLIDARKATATAAN